LLIHSSSDKTWVALVAETRNLPENPATEKSFP